MRKLKFRWEDGETATSLFLIFNFDVALLSFFAVILREACIQLRLKLTTAKSSAFFPHVCPTSQSLFSGSVQNRISRCLEQKTISFPDWKAIPSIHRKSETLWKVTIILIDLLARDMHRSRCELCAPNQSLRCRTWSCLSPCASASLPE